MRSRTQSRKATGAHAGPSQAGGNYGSAVLTCIELASHVEIPPRCPHVDADNGHSRWSVPA